ncbi:MAG: CorA family divalent cation transporter [Thiohalocapsa sp.]|jgi:magnesium transporter
MLQIYRIHPGRLEPKDMEAIGTDAAEDYWLDLRDPTAADRRTIEQTRGLVLPAINDVREIQATSRFFVDADGLHVRIWFLDDATGTLSRKPVAFVLSPHCLLSVTWGSVSCFETLRTAHSLGHHSATPVAVLFRLLEMHLDRTADLLEAAYEEIERRWASPTDTRQDLLEKQLNEICRLEGDRHKVHFALMDLQQVLAGLEREDAVPEAETGRFAAITRDLESLLAHSDFISEKLDFLIGMLISRLNLVDNRVGKILSVVALVFLPPTLIGSIYGMNFHYMPELAIPWAYPVALVAMLASAIIPYLVFKWRRWL